MKYYKCDNCNSLTEGYLNNCPNCNTAHKEISKEVYNLLKSINTKRKERMICPNCGSTDLIFDAAAVWNEETQDMELLNIYDNVDCNKCESYDIEPTIVYLEDKEAEAAKEHHQAKNEAQIISNQERFLSTGE